MTPVITTLVTQWPVLLAIAILYILHRQDVKLIEQKIDGLNHRLDDLKENINARFDDLKENINARFDDQKENINNRFDDQKENINNRFDDQKESINSRLDDQSRTLNTLVQKVDALSGRVHRIEGHLGLPRTGTEG